MAVLAAGCGQPDTPASLIAAGKEASAKNEPKAAVIRLRSALRLDQNATEARYLLGVALLKSGDAAGASAELSKALEQKYSPDLVLPPLAKALAAQGQSKKLVALYGDTQLTDPQAIAALQTQLAAAWGSEGQKAKTDAALAAALQAVADYPPALILKARVLAGARDPEGALALVDKVLARDPSQFDGWQLKGELLTHFKKDLPGAQAAFEKALSIEPAFLPSHLAIVSARLEAQDIAGARAQVDKLRLVQPSHPQVIFLDAQVAYAAREYAKARELSQQLLRYLPNHVGVLQLSGAIEGQAGSLVLAETRFAKALQLNPDLPHVRRSLAMTYLRLGQAQRALETLKPMLQPGSQDAPSHALAGEAYLRLADSAAAEASFRKAAAIDPSDDRVQTAIALSQLARGDPENAMASLTQLAARSKDTYVDSALVSARLKRMEYEEALQAVEVMAKKDPKSAEVAELRGRVHLERKDLEAARKAFEEALRLDPALFAATANLAGIDTVQGRPDDARKRFEQSLASDPKNHYAMSALADMKLRAGAPLEEVKTLLTNAISVAPTEVVPRLQLIDLLLKKRLYKEALAAAQDAAATMPNNPKVLDAVGRAQMESGDVEQALSSFRRLASLDESSGSAYLRLADVYLHSGKRPAAEVALKKALDLEPKNARYQEKLFDLYLKSNRKREAMDFAVKLQSRFPTQASGYALEALAHSKTKATDAALAALRKGVAVPGASPELARLLHAALVRAGRDAEADRFAAKWVKDHPDDVEFDYELAVTSISRGDLAQAEKLLRRVVSARPNNPLGLNNLAWTLAAQGRPGGIEYAQRAVNLMPDRPALIDTLAMTLAQDKQYAKALELQKRAVTLATEDKGLRLNLAKIALQAGDKTLAKAELEALKSVGPTLPYYEEVNRLLKTI